MISRIPMRLVRTYKALHFNAFKASFATSVELIDKSKAKLQKIVEKELKFEKSNYEIDTTAKDFIDSKGFEINETEGDNNVELFKAVGDVKILVCFQARPPSQDEEGEEGEEQKDVEPAQKNQEQQSDEENQDQEQQDYADFTVYLTKSNGQTLVYECSSASSEIQVNMVSVTQDIEKHKKIPRYSRGVDEYQGPDFQTLDERLQTALLEHLKGFGVNEELAAFVEHYSLDKEQRLYMQWLDQLTTYLKN